MADNAQQPINIEAIMDEIREQVKAGGPYEDVPAFEGIPLDEPQGPVEAAMLSQRIAQRAGNVAVGNPTPRYEGSKWKRLYKKLVYKAIKCALTPLGQRVTETNYVFLQCLEDSADVIARQQQQIDQLTRRIETLEKGK